METINACNVSVQVYRCLDKLILGKEARSGTDEDAQQKYDAKNQEFVMLIKLSVIDKMLPESNLGMMHSSFGNVY